MPPWDESRKRNLALRVASGVVLFPLAVWFTVLGGLPYALLVGLAAALSAAELVLMFGAIGVAGAFGIAVAGLLPVAALLGQGESLFPAWGATALAAAAVLLLGLVLFRRGPPEAVARQGAVIALSWLYCGLLLATAVGLRERFGVGWVILAYVVTWANDTFAFFAGHAFGRRRLLERISPKKTWEGFAGGAAGSLLGAIVTRALLPDLQAALGVWPTLAVAAGGAVLGPLGDLAESLVKRGAGVKDSGRIIPGHGGILDRIDALLFVVPWVYVFAGLLSP
ncbi:MAG TPA: phosphatidate cytidylyltransferase [Anaeromyxobacteraceae bacterium]|nr:phosphatidate cytidylyltransferase [Anaeromyxobacteraceae bacterium]